MVCFLSTGNIYTVGSTVSHGCETWSLTPRKKLRGKASENLVLRQKATEGCEKYIITNAMILNLHEMFIRVIRLGDEIGGTGDKQGEIRKVGKHERKTKA
jgi:hypothetical protein